MKQNIIFLILLFVASSIAAQEPLSRDLWLNEAGAPVKVKDIAQDPQTGYIWLATDEGAYCYNGLSFRHIEDSTRVGITAVEIGKDKVWLGYKDGRIATVQHGVHHWEKMKGQPIKTAIADIQVRTDNMIWVCTEGEGLFFIVNNDAVAYDKRKGLSDNYVYTYASIDTNRILVATDNGINELTLGGTGIRAKHLNTSNGLPDNIVRVVKPVPDICWSWIGTHQGGLALYCSHSHKVWTPKADVDWQWGAVYDILPISMEDAWVVTNTGYLLNVQLLDSERINVKAYHFEGQKFNRLLLDHTGNIWCATNMGLKQITAEYLQKIAIPEPYDINKLTVISYDKQNNFWYAQGNMLYCYNVMKGMKPAMVYSAPSTITALYNDRYNHLWIGTLNDGVFVRTDKGAVVKINGIDPLSTEGVLDITGTNDRIWVAGLHGVEELKYTNGQVNDLNLVKLHNKHSGIGSDYVYQLYADKKQRIWMATDGGGVSMYDGQQYHRWDSAHGMQHEVVYTVAEDATGKIWAATLEDGLIVYDGTMWRSLGEHEGLRDNNVTALAPTASGQMVVVHSKGIDVWYPNSMQFRHYDANGELGIQEVSGTLKLAATDTTGNAYVPYQGGLLMFRRLDSNYTIAPYISISGIALFFKDIAYGRQDFKYKDNELTFYFDGTNLATTKPLVYRYWLEGYNDSWIVTSDRSVTFPQLPDGDYTLKIQASHSDNFVSPAEVSYSFTIDKPYWKEIWFFVLMGTVIWAMAYIYVRLRERNLRKVGRLQRERMMFEYEHLKSQVNPHFLFNSLNTLTSLIEDDKDAALDYTVHLSDLYRNLLLYRDKDMITLKEEWVIVENYIYVQKSRFGDALKLEVNIPDEVMKTGKVMPLALQLLVENAIKHNVVSLSKPLTISIVAEHGYLTIKNPIQEKLSKEDGAGLGLINIRKRYKLLSGKDIVHRRIGDDFVVILPIL